MDITGGMGPPCPAPAPAPPILWQTVTKKYRGALWTSQYFRNQRFPTMALYIYRDMPQFTAPPPPSFPVHTPRLARTLDPSLVWGCPPPVLMDPEAPSPEVPMARLSGRLRLPRVGLGAARPPQTLGDPGAVKPDTCPCPCTRVHTTASIHGPDRGHWGPYARQSAEYLRSPAHAVAAATCHAVGDEWAVVHSPRSDARGRSRATRPQNPARLAGGHQPLGGGGGGLDATTCQRGGALRACHMGTR